MSHLTPEVKEAVLAALTASLQEQRQQLAAIDKRLAVYYDGLCARPEWHNAYELLGALRSLRILRQYPFNASRVQHVIHLYEGYWVKRDGRYHHVRGGFLFSGMAGLAHYCLTPIQVYMLAMLFGPHTWVDTGATAGSRELLPTERIGASGTIEDLRQLHTEAVFFLPRKFGKTTLGAFILAYYFFFGDHNAELYCVANSQSQSKIIYTMARDLIKQLDPEGHRIRFTSSETGWRSGQPRSAHLAALSAGGKTKDGLFAQVCAADEYGSATYVKDKSDMDSLVNVVMSSTGPRREPLLLITTTAGHVTAGPFEQRLRAIKGELQDELLQPMEGEARAATSRRFSVLLCPDDWEVTDEELLLTSEDIWRKCNPHISITVQPDFYHRAFAAARLDEGRKRESIVKLLNVYATTTVKEWITPAQIEALQIPMRIEDCSMDAGWTAFCGMDFSLGNDLHAQTYLAYNVSTGAFFADMDAWISEHTLANSAVRPLYEQWVNAGWLRVSPGAMLQPDLPVSRIVELSEQHGVNFVRFGYDPFQAKQPINTLSAWLYTQGLEPKDYVVPVRQTFASYNPAVLELDYMVRNTPPLIRFSSTPMWPWEFGNCFLAESTDGMENRKPLKRHPGADGCKIDNVQCLCTALILFDQVDGSTH